MAEDKIQSDKGAVSSDSLQCKSYTGDLMSCTLERLAIFSYTCRM